jgi:hypothetical protein
MKKICTKLLVLFVGDQKYEKIFFNYYIFDAKFGLRDLFVFSLVNVVD